jgi:hypothetical protein
LHGNATMLQDFLLSEAFTSAAKQSRAIAFDRPGFGYSTRLRGRTWTASEQADVIAEALRRLNLRLWAIPGARSSRLLLPSGMRLSFGRWHYYRVALSRPTLRCCSCQCGSHAAAR